jgi:polysaccharide biosynthesis transport protein
MTRDLPFRELVGILRRRIWLILTVVAVGTTLVAAVWLLIPPRYTAKSVIIVEPQPASPIGRQAEVVAAPPDIPVILTNVAALTTYDHLVRVLDSLSTDPEFEAATKTRTEPTVKIDELWRSITGWPLPSWLKATGEQSTMTVRELQHQLKVYQESGSHAIAVEFTSSSPQEAALVANRVTQLYLQSQVDEKRRSTDSALAWLKQRIPELKIEVERQTAAAQDYQTTHGLAGTDQVAEVNQEVADLNRQRLTADLDTAARQARLANARELRRRGADTDTLARSLDSPALTELHRQEIALLQSHADLAGAISGMHPKMQQQNFQLQEVRREINQEVDRTLASLENETQVAASQEHLIQQRLVNLQNPSASVHLRDMERQAASTRQLYESLLQRREELLEQRQFLSPDVRILSFAAAPERPSSPSPILLGLPTLVFFVICGCLLAVIVEKLDTTLRSERDVNEALNVPCIGLVPQLRRLGRTRPHHSLVNKPFAPYSEAIRSVVAALQLAAPTRAPQVILISSSVPGEGKTTLAVSFAAYAALLGKRVILVDLDFRHPSILRELGGKVRRGVLDLLLNGVPSAEVIQRVPGLGLDYLSVRDSHRIDPLRLFAGEQLSRLLRQLRNDYDCVVIDSAPLLAMTEARLLASMVDKVLFVVKWGSTRRNIAQNALDLLRNQDLLDDDGSRIAGVVMTQVDLKKHARYRYGDRSEVLVKYGRYYAQATEPSMGRRGVIRGAPTRYVRYEAGDGEA